MKTCEHCRAPIHIETATFTEFTCGAGFEIAGTELQTRECDEATRAQRAQHAKDLEADDEINRRRMGRHFESQHWGT